MIVLKIKTIQYALILVYVIRYENLLTKKMK